MSQRLAAQDRSALIRLASGLPAGSSERRAILAGLAKQATVFTSDEQMAKYLKEHPKADPHNHSVKEKGDKSKGDPGKSAVNTPGKHILGRAKVSDKAKVYDEAHVSQDAQVYDNAEVKGRAQVSGDAKVYGDASVSGGYVGGDAHVYGDAKVSGGAKVLGKAKVSGNADISGNAVILGGVWDGSEGKITSGRWKAPGVPG